MGTLPFDTAAADPRSGNMHRENLLAILQTLMLPPNHQVVMDVDKHTEKLRLVVLKRKVSEIRLFNRFTLWRFIQNWDDPETELRRIEGRSYHSILEQLKAMPEFLEFEVTVQGATAPRPVHIF
jgi:hypothetical protein